MYCKKCGSFVSSGDNVCRMCGQRIDESVEQDSQSIGYDYSETPNRAATYSDSRVKVAKAFMIVTIAFYSLSALVRLLLGIAAGLDMLTIAINVLFALVPFIWIIPMYCHFNKKIANFEPISVAFKVCTLLFVNMVSGILLLTINDKE